MASAVTAEGEAFRRVWYNIDHVVDSDYRDDVIKLEIHGNTVREIDKVAGEEGLTAAQWIRMAIATKLIK